MYVAPCRAKDPQATVGANRQHHAEVLCGILQAVYLCYLAALPELASRAVSSVMQHYCFLFQLSSVLAPRALHHAAVPGADVLSGGARNGRGTWGSFDISVRLS